MESWSLFISLLGGMSPQVLCKDLQTISRTPKTVLSFFQVECLPKYCAKTCKDQKGYTHQAWKLMAFHQILSFFCILGQFWLDLVISCIVVRLRHICPFKSVVSFSTGGRPLEGGLQRVWVQGIICNKTNLCKKNRKKYNLKYKASDKIRSAARCCAGRRSATRCAKMTRDILTKLGTGGFLLLAPPNICHLTTC